MGRAFPLYLSGQSLPPLTLEIVLDAAMFAPVASPRANGWRVGIYALVATYFASHPCECASGFGNYLSQPVLPGRPLKGSPSMISH
jgi:hypothetical protein